MDAKALPFATYDVAVYLPGGAIILILAAQALTGVQALTGLDIGIDPPFLNSNLTSSDTVNGFIEAIFWLGFSYLVGHLAAFISTYVVERPLHNWLGYPSELWLERENLTEDQASAKEFEQNFWKRYAILRSPFIRYS